MTIDKAQLKALAEAAGNDEWYADGDLRYCDDKTGETHGMHHDDSRFIAAARPAAILALLAEIERLEGCDKAYKEAWEKARDLQSEMDEVVAERDTLRAELAGLRTGYEAQNNVIEGLRNGFGAIRVVAGCPVDGKVIPVVDALRKDAERYRWLIGPNVYNGTIGIADGWIDFEDKAEAQQQIDAAMAKDGVQIKAHSDPEVSDLAARIDYLEKDNASLRGSCAALGKKLTEATRNLRSAQRTLSWLMFNREISTDGMPKWVLNRFKRLIKYQEKPVE